MTVAPGSQRQQEAAYHSVVIVGAGVAGLQAARELLPSFPDLLVLEASDRVGGRIKQVTRAPSAHFTGSTGSRPNALCCGPTT